MTQGASYLWHVKSQKVMNMLVAKARPATPHRATPTAGASFMASAERVPGAATSIAAAVSRPTTAV
jgi:hypothetical protein